MATRRPVDTIARLVCRESTDPNAGEIAIYVHRMTGGKYRVTVDGGCLCSLPEFPQVEDGSDAVEFDSCEWAIQCAAGQLAAFAAAGFEE